MIGLLGLTLAVSACAPEGGFLPSGFFGLRSAPEARLQTFEALRGDSFTAEGYHFSVSPDESWIFRTVLAVPAEAQARLLHLPSGRSWSTPLDLGSPQGWEPDCFSVDGTRLRLGRQIAPLEAEMEALRFEEPEEGQGVGDQIAGNQGPPLGDGLLEQERIGELATTHLGRKSATSLLASSAAGGWQMLLGEGGPSAAGPVDFVPVGNERPYDFLPAGTIAGAPGAASQALRSSRLEGPYLRLGPLLRAEREYWMEIMDRLQVEGRLTPQTRQRLERRMRWQKVQLRHFAPSPNGRYAAAVMYLDDARSHGVLIPLGDRSAEVRSFEINVYGKMTWSEDGQRLYFYSQPEPGGGNGTVHRLEIPG
ncbi:MAG: hypothetical protein AAGD01_19640 [Acidobacteriota bacterium]